MWVFPEGAEAPEGGHPRINSRLPENPQPEMVPAGEDRIWSPRVSKGARAPEDLKAAEVLMDWF